MNFVVHNINQKKIAELISEKMTISGIQDILDLMANVSSQEIDRIILKEHQISNSFFELKNGIAGEILQKCVNYGMKLAIVGNYEKYNSKSLNAFILECNRGNQFHFVENINEAKEMLAKL